MVAQVDNAYIKARPTRLWSRLLSYALFEGRPLTTRGQWINPLLFKLFALQKRLPQMRKSVAPVFILGTGRSGTTILGVVLSMHHDVGFLNEPKAIWASLREDEDLIGSYHRGAARYRLTAEDAPASLIREAQRIYGAYLGLTLTRRVVDKYPELIFRVPFVRQIFPDAKFLFLSRDGWDTCASIDNWSSRLGAEVDGEVHDWWGVNRRKWNLLVDQIVQEHSDLAPHAKELRALDDHRAMAATEWIVTMREGLQLLDKYPNDVLHVPYALLCEDPEGMCRRIAKFSGLANDEVFIDYARQVLSPVPAKEEFPLPAMLEASFRNTCEALRAREVMS
ncbi:sulfotransferase [Marinobacter sp.]|uniref:sulfotransferase family protein n=1 Tax=Marinobacter sp. TaxID=50741 RepID=UPI002B269FF6|nr:sulfotransferase [Marinobacter sp.]